MDISEVIKNRRTIRKWTDKSIPKELILDLIDHAQWAPSACNFQAWEFIVITDHDLKKELCQKTRVQPALLRAPSTIFVCYDKRFTPENYADIQSASAAIQNMLLYAHSKGLGGAWINTLGDKNILKEILKIPKELEIVALVLLGYPDEISKAPTRRKPLSDIIYWDYYHSDGNEFPDSQYPDDWGLEALNKYRELHIRAKSKFHPSNFEEFETVINYFEQKGLSGEKWLDIFPCNGVYLKEIHGRWSNSSEIEFSEISEEIIDFINQNCKVPLKGFIWNNQYHSGNKYSLISCIFRLEAYPEAIQRKILSWVYKQLQINGRLILVFYNYNSYWWILKRLQDFIGHTDVKYTMYVAPNRGPFKPLKSKKIEEMVASIGFQIREKKHYFLLPGNEELNTYLEKIKEKRKVNLFYPIFLFFARVTNFTSKYANRLPFLNRYSKVQIWEICK